MKTLRETIKAGMPFGAEGLTMDTFGAIMDKFIDESNVALLIHKEAGGDWQIRGVGCGAVVAPMAAIPTAVGAICAPDAISAVAWMTTVIPVTTPWNTSTLCGIVGTK